MQVLVAGDDYDEPAMPCYRIRLDEIFLVLSIGAYEHERDRPQRVRIDLEMTVNQDLTATGDRLTEVVSYDGLLDRIEDATRGRHICLLETLALEIADLCFADPRVQRVAVSVRKPDIFNGRAVPSVQIDLTRSGAHGMAAPARDHPPRRPGGPPGWRLRR
ncbi:hypothetical protein TSO352_05450 [Azospirillum sp. TSO35-2]|nr:hypothetical protein TSO352_05450 [Azospirillum sp. TSO35-2]